MTERMIAIWTSAFEIVLWRVPGEIREQVLNALLEQERARKKQTHRLFQSSAEFVAGLDSGNYLATKEAASLMVQVLTRSITNNFSKDDAAGILFRDHRGLGTGSGWLPDYLDGLPGITVDKAKCIAIADSAGPSRLREVAKATASEHGEFE